jgi:peptide/nickel transport system substrate-binding protein
MINFGDISRRSFITKSLVSATGVLLTGCFSGLDNKNQKTNTAQLKEIKDKSLYGESPMLTEKVLAGELPLVQDRLPKNPFVRTVETEGIYGGTFYADTQRQGGHFFFDGSLSTSPQETDNNGIKIIPHVCEKVERSEDLKEFTFYLREGLRWSDGVECTADDIIWWWEHEQNNKDLYPGGPRVQWKVGNEYAKFTKISKWVFKISFAGPFAPLDNLSAHDSMKFGGEFGQPAHYMKQFHIDFNPNANEVAKSYGYDAWFMLYKEREEFFRPHGGKPNLAPWYRSESTTTHDIYLRNPYFFEVDQYGNQLPYVDKMFISVVEDRKLRDSRIATGAATMGRSVLSQIFIYTKNQKKADYSLKHWTMSNSSECMFAFNLNHKDPVLREIYNDLRFRQAMSIAINRKRINDLLFFGLAKEWQSTVSPDVSFFDPKWVQHFAEYDEKRANDLLDEMGLKWDAQRRFRLRPDGGRFITEVIYNQQDYPLQLIELVAQDWAAVGMETILRQADDQFRRQKCLAADHDCTCWNADVIEEIAIYMPWTTKWNPNGQLYYAVDWWNWFYSGGKNGVEPPDIWKEQFNRMVKWYFAKTREEYEQYGYDVWNFFSQQIVTIGTVGYSPLPVVAKNGLMNLQEHRKMGYGLGWAKTFFPQMYYWDKPELHL